MILPVYAYGTKILREKSNQVETNYTGLHELIANMFETMHNTEGIGLAAPQIGLSIKLFVVDASPLDDQKNNLKDFKKVFINPKIIKEEGEKCNYKEGCLSIPGIQEEVMRKSKIRITYHDENFIGHDEIFDKIPARIILHEYDHLEGILFTDRLDPLKKRLLHNKLQNISKGNIEVGYNMIFAKKNN